MRNITKTGYEALTIVRSLNDPTLGFGLAISPSLWINECNHKKFFVFAPQGCISEIYELSQAINDYIDGIITPCGTILPINNKIEFLSSEGIDIECIEGKIRFVIKAPLDPSLGGTGFITYNEGDILVGNKDGKLSILLKGQIGQALGIKEDGTVGYIDVIKKLTCEGSDPVTENALTRWSPDGKCLKNSKSIQDDQGNTNTRTSLDGTLNFITANNSEDPNSSAVHSLEAKGGRPINRLLIPNKQLVDSYISNKDYSYNIFLNNLEDSQGGRDILQITRRGAVKLLNQPQGLIVLENNTGNVTGNNNWYRLGTTETWRVIFDNYKIFTSLGGSAQNPLKAVLNEGGSYQFKVGIALNTPGRATSLQFRILTKGRQYFSFGNVPQGLTDGYLSDNIGVIADTNDELLFEVWAGISTPKLEVRIIGRNWPVLFTGIFYYLMG